MGEYLVVLHSNAVARDHERVVSAIRAANGRIVQHAVPRAILCLSDDPEAIRRINGITEVTDRAIEDVKALNLDREALALVSAWNARRSAAYAAGKSNRVDEGKPWDFHGQKPGGTGISKEDSPFGRAMAPSPIPTNTSQYMIGTVACGLVIVDGPGNAAFTQPERDNVLAEVQEAFTNLVSLSPAGANLSFLIDQNHASLTDADTSAENVWIPNAVTFMGYNGTGWNGMYDYLHYLRTQRWSTLTQGPDWAYIAFVTKYQVDWFAYAFIGGPYLVIQYSNDGWGSNQIDRVFAHESGHIFRAPDEYASSECSVGGAHGYLGVPNDNCANNNPGSIDCLMKGNTYAICPSTLGHLGWRDLDADGTPDPVDTTGGAYVVDVGVSPGSPSWDNADLWIRNQDDGEVNQQHENPRSDVDNFIYARVKNFGSTTAEIIRARFYLAPYLGTEFEYPQDYTNLIVAPDTPYPTIFALSPGAEAIAKVRLQKSQIPPETWHTCLLSEITSPQQAATPAGSNVLETNSLAQKNLTIVYVAAGQTITIPIMLKSLSSKRKHFRIQRKCPASVLTSLCFSDRQIKLKPLKVGEVAECSGGEAGNGHQIRFLKESQIELASPAPVRIHMAAGSWMELSAAVASESGPAEPVGAAVQIPGHLSFPISDVTRPFRLNQIGKFAKLAGLSITVPALARLGERYRFEVQEFDEAGRQIGGVGIEVRMATRRMQLEDRLKRTGVLRHQANASNSAISRDLADATEALIAEHLVAVSGRPSKVMAARVAFVKTLTGAATTRKWEVPVDGLVQSAAAVRVSGDLSVSLDALDRLLFQAQESLLSRYTF